VLSAFLLAAVLLSSCAGKPATPRSITVPGEGKVLIAPDVVTVNLGIQTHDADVQKAVADNNQTAAAIMAAARNVGVSDADMQTAYFNVYPSTVYDEFGNPTDQITYNVDNNLSVRLRDVTKLSELLQHAVDAGASNIYGVTFAISDTAAAEEQARTLAMNDALARAGQIAVTTGLVLGDPITISSGVLLPQPVYYGNAAYGVGGGGGPPVSTGMNTVTANVTVTYAVR
jgi:uncharacterized protein YggE